MYKFRLYVTEVRSQGSKQQYSSIGLDNGLALTVRQAIIWTNHGQFTDHASLGDYASLGLKSYSVILLKKIIYIFMSYTKNGYEAWNCRMLSKRGFIKYSLTQAVSSQLE